MKRAICVACFRADFPQRVRAVAMVGGRPLCRFHVFGRGPHICKATARKALRDEARAAERAAEHGEGRRAS